MQKIICRFTVMLSAMISLFAVADELTSYVQNCESQLEFTASQVPSLNCNDGLLFDHETGTQINDYVGHARVNAYVDLVFACRWLNQLAPTYSKTAASVELLIHNRQNGATCFFAAKDFSNPIESVETVVSTSIVSPTDSNASNYWMQPTEIENKSYRFGGAPSIHTRLRCVGCHVAGPYIASNNIAPNLARFGLLNDGHDTYATRYHAVHSIVDPRTGIEPFKWWDTIIQGNNSTSGAILNNGAVIGSAGCAVACHSMGVNSTSATIFGAGGQSGLDRPIELIPALSVRTAAIALAGIMPAGRPTNSAQKQNSLNYAWVNIVSPRNNTTGESETLSNLQNTYPALYCKNPTSLSAHVIDSDEIINTSEAPDKLDRFNLQDGLVCLNRDQSSGQCRNYQTRYLCNGSWTAWQDNDDPSYSGDWEPRNGFKNLCASPAGIQARYKVGSTWIIFNGPPDRLAQFDNKGLTCYNSEQNNGQCSNYVVRFECP